MISINQDSDGLFHMSGTIEHFEAEKGKSLFAGYLDKANKGEINFDISRLESVSSVTLSFLLFGIRKAQTESCELHYKNMSPELFNMARVSGIENILVS